MSTQTKRLLSIILAVILLIASCILAVKERSKDFKEENSNQLLAVAQDHDFIVDSEKIQNLFVQEISAAELNDAIDEIEETVEETVEESIVVEEEIAEEVVIEEEVEEFYYAEDEIMTIASVVEAETKGQDMDSKIHIVHVIRNRVNSEKFPNDYYSVCTAPNQFASRWDIEQSTIDAVHTALAMEDTTGGALYFCLCKESCWLLGTSYQWLFQDSAGHHFWG